jgi:hypothetical protein
VYEPKVQRFSKLQTGGRVLCQPKDSLHSSHDAKWIPPRWMVMHLFRFFLSAHNPSPSLSFIVTIIQVGVGVGEQVVL